MLRRTFLAGLAGIAVAAVDAVPAQASQWVMIGEQTVGINPDRDTLILGADEGRYEALKFHVSGNRVAFAEVRVVFGNGTSEVLNVKEHVRPGETTRAYDLRGQHRIIDRIEFLYQSENPWAGRATVKVYGLKYTGPGPSPGGWAALGTREVNLVTDHDTIFVGLGSGRFRTIRFHVTGRPIFLYNVKVPVTIRCSATRSTITSRLARTLLCSISPAIAGSSSKSTSCIGARRSADTPT